METNVTIAVIAASGVVISAICVLGAGMFAYIASNKRFDKIDTTLEIIRKDMQEFYRSISN